MLPRKRGTLTTTTTTSRTPRPRNTSPPGLTARRRTRRSELSRWRSTRRRRRPATRYSSAPERTIGAYPISLSPEATAVPVASSRTSRFASNRPMVRRRRTSSARGTRRRRPGVVQTQYAASATIGQNLCSKGSQSATVPRRMTAQVTTSEYTVVARCTIGRLRSTPVSSTASCRTAIRFWERFRGGASYGLWSMVTDLP